MCNLSFTHTKIHIPITHTCVFKKKKQGPDLRAVAHGAARPRLGAVRRGARPDGALRGQHPRGGGAVTAPGVEEGLVVLFRYTDD